MSVWKRPSVKRARRAAVLAAILIIGFYLAPLFIGFMLLCGLLDISRHRHFTYELVEKYFAGNGVLTWLLSPINLLADLFSMRNRVIYRLEDLPPEHRQEIETCVREFVANGDRIKEHVQKTLAGSRRGMLTFKWFNAPQSTLLTIPAFQQDFRFIKTIAVSVFNTRERTSWHFGPLRFTFRVLYNLDPIDSREVFIEVDGQTHYWIDEPLFIFDDTVFHRSINDVDHVRYCLFMDIVRPNYAHTAFDLAVHTASAISSSFKRMFYKNWSFIR